MPHWVSVGEYKGMEVSVMNTIDDALNKYLEKGFGSMNKNDFEVWIFNHLMHSMLKGKDNYAISTYLKIPESKVKRLRYEASLKYSSFSEQELFSTVNKLLSKSKFKKGGLYIQFVVEDVAIRKYLDSLLKRDGRFSDSSFNSEIVTIDIDDLEYILLSMPEGKKNIDEILSKAKKKLKTTDVSFKSLMSTFASSMAIGAGSKVGEKLVDLSCIGISLLLNQL